MRLLLPKPETDWSRWRDGLSGLDIELTLVDPWRLTRLEETPAQRSLWLELDLFAGVICVSRRAVQRSGHGRGLGAGRSVGAIS